MRLVVEVTDELHRALKVKAAQEGSSISEMVRGLAYGHVGELADMVGKPETSLSPGKPMSDPMVYGHRPLPDARDDVIPDAGPVRVTNASMTSNSAASVTNAPKQAATRQYLDLTKTSQAKGKMGHR